MHRRQTFIKALGIAIMMLLLLAGIVSSTPFAYVTNEGSNTLSIIDTVTYKVIATVNVGLGPAGIAVSPDGKQVYVANCKSNSLSAIDASTNTVVATINVGDYPLGVAVNPAGTKVYVTNVESNNIYVIDTANNTVSAIIAVGKYPLGVAVTPDGTKVYVTNVVSNNLSVIDTSLNRVIYVVEGLSCPVGVALNADGTKAYVANSNNNSVSVINTSTDTIAATVNGLSKPYGVAVNPLGTKVYVTNFASNKVSAINTATNTIGDQTGNISVFDTVANTITVGKQPYGVAIAPDGKKVNTKNNGANNDLIIDATAGNLTVGSNPCAIAVNPDGTKIYVVNSLSNTVSVIDTLKTVFIDEEHEDSNFSSLEQLVVTPPLHTVSPFSNFHNFIKICVSLLNQFTSHFVNIKNLNQYFDKGGVSTQKNPVYMPSEGNHIVPLTSNNILGTDVMSREINFSKHLSSPIAAFCAFPTTGTAPVAVTFTDQSTGSPKSWKWSFGDRTTSTERNPIHTYSKEGKYAVTLKTSKTYMSSSVTKLSYIIISNRSDSTVASSNRSDSSAASSNRSDIPVASFYVSPTSGKVPLKVKFLDQSYGTPTSWKWDFGDGGYLTSEISGSPTHIYSSAGKYTVTLKVNNDNGSSTQTMTKYITVS